MNQYELQIVELERKMQMMDAQQVTPPLDNISYSLLRKDIPVVNGGAVIPFSLATYDQHLQVDINGVKYYLETTKVQ